MIPVHQWTHDGVEVLILKCVPPDGRITGTANDGRRYDFTWPLVVGADVVAPDWRPVTECGGGLHGWPWGLAIGDGKEPDWAGTWIVFGANPADVLDLGGKVKCRAGVVRFVGGWQAATNFLLRGQIAWTVQASGGQGHATGYRSVSSATGYRSASSATGYSSAAVATGLDGRAQAGPWGVLALAWWNETARRGEMRCARVGVGDGSDGLLKALVWYRLDQAGAFVEADLLSVKGGSWR